MNIIFTPRNASKLSSYLLENKISYRKNSDKSYTIYDAPEALAEMAIKIDPTARIYRKGTNASLTKQAFYALHPELKPTWLEI